MAVEFIPIENSSNVKGAHYDPITQRLIVRFGNGTHYGYLDVTPFVWQEFQQTFDGSSSAGKFLNTEIKGRFTCVPFSPEEVEALG